MKIVFIGHLPGFGGAEKSMIMTANVMAKKGHAVSIVSVKSNNPVYPINEEVTYIHLPDKSNLKVANIIGRLNSIHNTLIRLEPDIVVCFWLQVAILSTVISKLYGFKVIYSERGDPGDSEYNGLLGLVRKLVFPLIHGFVFQSEGARNYFSAKIQRKSTIIPNPVYISLDDYSIPVQRNKIIVNIGRLHPQKNQKLLINAFSRVVKDFPSYFLHIYGDGELREELQGLIDNLGLSSSIKLMGTTDKLWDYIVNSSLFVLSSDYEGMPNALMEAMALGIPCISANCPPGGIAELIEHGTNGLIFPVGDEKQLEEYMRKVLNDKCVADLLALNAKNICITHSPSLIFNRWEKYLKDVLYSDAN